MSSTRRSGSTSIAAGSCTWRIPETSASRSSVIRSDQSPRILSVTDVGVDQGRQVRVRFRSLEPRRGGVERAERGLPLDVLRRIDQSPSFASAFGARGHDARWLGRRRFFRRVRRQRSTTSWSRRLRFELDRHPPRGVLRARRDRDDRGVLRLGDRLGLLARQPGAGATRAVHRRRTPAGRPRCTGAGAASPTSTPTGSTAHRAPGSRPDRRTWW